MAIAGRPELERTRYRQGQRLRSRDLNNQLADEAEIRWWHNRALHAAYGVVQGLDVEIRGEEVLVWSGRDDGQGAEAAKPAGFAYDCYGRELIVARPMTLPLPPAEPPEALGWTLLLRRAALSSGMPSCVSDARATAVELVWTPSRLSVLPYDGVPLARGVYDTSGIFVLEQSFTRPLARALARPLIASGVTVAGKTAWRPWQLRLGVERIVAGVEVTIDTSAAGFTETPCYFAWLCGGQWQLLGRRSVVEFLDRITVAKVDSLTFSLWPRPGAVGSVKSGLGLLGLAKQRLSVGWIGVQPETVRVPESTFLE